MKRGKKELFSKSGGEPTIKVLFLSLNVHWGSPQVHAVVKFSMNWACVHLSVIFINLYLYKLSPQFMGRKWLHPATCSIPLSLSLYLFLVISVPYECSFIGWLWLGDQDKQIQHLMATDQYKQIFKGKWNQDFTHKHTIPQTKNWGLLFPSWWALKINPQYHNWRPWINQ